jgi:RNA polymerase sigma-70 factor (ECF subfamily)
VSFRGDSIGVYSRIPQKMASSGVQILASETARATDIMAKSRTEQRVEPAKSQVLRFPGSSGPGESCDATERRDEERLLVEIAAGYQNALAALYRRRGALFYSLLVRMLVSETEAQEVMQDTFVQIWRRARVYDPRRSSPIAWMIMIARGVAMDRLRARLRRNATHETYQREVASLAVEEMDGLRHTERGELAAACAAALHGLPEPQRRVLELAFFRGWTHEEIACAEGDPLGTIKARIRRGLLAMRQALKDHHV